VRRNRRRRKSEVDDRRGPDVEQTEVRRVVWMRAVVVWVEWSFDSFRQRKYIPADRASRIDFSVRIWEFKPMTNLAWVKRPRKSRNRGPLSPEAIVTSEYFRRWRLSDHRITVNGRTFHLFSMTISLTTHYVFIHSVPPHGYLVHGALQVQPDQ
jgi:hypothetical protein